MSTLLLLGEKADRFLMNEGIHEGAYPALKKAVSNSQGKYHYFMHNDRSVLEIEDTSLVDMRYVQKEISKDELKTLQAWETKFYVEECY